ncbi:S8/S53 family peptidase [Streptomyces flavalbus]|uniref:S8/S53 family peptidase n=1 Tax=Streptomyces flavalbus TaxID=2665155 RepID=A0ABW2WGP9_9ACTN
MAPQRFREQFGHIQRSMPDVPLAMGPDDSAEFLYEKGVVLVRDGEDAALVEDAVRTYFTETPDLDPEPVRRVSPRANRTGVTRIQVGDPGQGGAEGDPMVGHALRAVRERAGRARRRLVSRNHVIHIAPVNACPGDEPVPAPRADGTNPAPAPGVAHDPDTAVGVLVIDTGLLHDYQSWPQLAHVDGDMAVQETDADGMLKQYVGHGTFIAGVVSAVAPNTNVTVLGTLSDVGAMLESDFGAALFDSVDRHGWPDIISLSAGTTNGGLDGLLGMDAFMAELRQQRTLLVAAAGNNGSSTPFWPAAYASQSAFADSVLSVGALRGDGAYGACFTNHGPWVRVFAPGERLTSSLTGFTTPVPYVYQHSTYDTCRYGFGYACTCQEPSHSGVLSDDGAAAKPDQVMFEGLAHWSGTSFATPVVAGMVADLMVSGGQRDPRAAAQQLLSQVSEFAEVRGADVPALKPSTWSPVPVQAPAASV